MPAELKDAPGYAPFTLSAGAQAWVDSMEDGKIVDGGTCVYGRPRPRTVQQHRSLATPSASTAPPNAQTWPPPATAPPAKPRSAQVLMPDIEGSASPRAPRPPRPPTIFDIGGLPAQPASRSASPARGQAQSQPGSNGRTLPRRILMPEIDAPQVMESAPRGPRIPDVEQPATEPSETRGRQTPLMPDIADDEPPRPHPPVMPDIG
jgi:hypothetical protein